MLPEDWENGISHSFTEFTMMLKHTAPECTLRYEYKMYMNMLFVNFCFKKYSFATFVTFLTLKPFIDHHIHLI